MEYAQNDKMHALKSDGDVRGTSETKALKSGGVFPKYKTTKQSIIIWLAAFLYSLILLA